MARKVFLITFSGIALALPCGSFLFLLLDILRNGWETKFGFEAKFTKKKHNEIKNNRKKNQAIARVCKQSSIKFEKKVK